MFYENIGSNTVQAGIVAMTVAKHHRQLFRIIVLDEEAKLRSRLPMTGSWPWTNNWRAQQSDSATHSGQLGITVLLLMIRLMTFMEWRIQLPLPSDIILGYYFNFGRWVAHYGESVWFEFDKKGAKFGSSMGLVRVRSDWCRRMSWFFRKMLGLES